MMQKTLPTLHSLAHSQALRVSWALEEIQLANPSFKFEQKNYPRTYDNAGLHKIHSLGKSPVLTLESTDGSPPPTLQLEPGLLSESQLILKFLNNEYAKELWTPSAEDKNRDDFFFTFASDTLARKNAYCIVYEVPAQKAPFPLNLVFKMTAYPMVSRYLSDLQGVYQIMEDALSDEKPYFSGATLGLADINAIYGIDVAEQRGYLSFEGGRFPKLKAWGERIRGREGYKRAVAKSGGYDLQAFGNKGGWAMVLGRGAIKEE